MFDVGHVDGHKRKTPCVHNQQACVAGVNGGGGGVRAGEKREE